MDGVADASGQGVVEALRELREALKARNQANKQIAWVLGRDPSLVSKLLNGHQPISPEYLHKLCVNALGLRPGDDGYRLWFKRLSVTEPLVLHEEAREALMKGNRLPEPAPIEVRPLDNAHTLSEQFESFLRRRQWVFGTGPHVENTVSYFLPFRRKTITVGVRNSDRLISFSIPLGCSVQETTSQEATKLKVYQFLAYYNSCSSTRATADEDGEISLMSNLSLKLLREFPDDLVDDAITTVSKQHCQLTRAINLLLYRDLGIKEAYDQSMNEPQRPVPELPPKILPLPRLGQIAREMRAKGNTLILVHGVFDRFEPVHVGHLLDAKGHGDCLFVTVTGDAYVKDRELLNPQQARVDMLAAIQFIDFIGIVEAEDGCPAIDEIKPDFYVKGEDWANKLSGEIDERAPAELECVLRHGGRRIVTTNRVFPDHAKSSRAMELEPV